MVILVTHQLQFLMNVKNILVIKEGAQNALGDFQQITMSGFDIQEILKSYNKSLGNEKQKKSFKKETTKALNDLKALTGAQSTKDDDDIKESPDRK